MKHGHRWLLAALVAVALVVALAMIVTGAQGSLAAEGTIYVDADATGANNGSSWADAYTNLQPALDEAVAGDQIWVAKGIYTPTVEHGGTGSYYRSFQLLNGVALYGGFDPSVDHTTWGDRDWVTHETILSGDLNGDDGPGLAHNGKNSYHVFYHPEGTDLDGSAILDGFLVTGGSAGGYPFSPHYAGGGMYNVGSSPTLSNVTFAGNAGSRSGGGMINVGSSPTLTNCTFSGNSGGWGYGGGMVNSSGSSPTLTNCTFSGNGANFGGGGMSNSGGSSPTLTNCTFSDNGATWGGGGMYNSGSSPTLVNCTFSGNSVFSRGGGMENDSGSSPRLTNSTFSGNRSSYYGGGMSNSGGSSPMLTNCTFSGNEAGYEGGGMSNSGGSSPTLTNCILWGDTPSEIYQYDVGSTPRVTYSDIQGGYTGEGNIDADPLFLDPTRGDYHLQPGSPCIDVGTNASPNLPNYDFEGHPRIMDGDGDAAAIVDMGVDEVFRYRVYLPVAPWSCFPP